MWNEWNPVASLNISSSNVAMHTMTCSQWAKQQQESFNVAYLV